MDWRRADLTAELDRARDAIAAAAGAPVTEAAIPFGCYDRAVLRALREWGYAACYTSDGGAARPGEWPVPRVSLTDAMYGAAVEDLVIGREPVGRRLRRPIAKLRKRLL